MASAGPLQLRWRPYRFALPQAMVTSQGAWRERCGWLLRLQSSAGALAWGEAPAPPGDEQTLERALAQLPAQLPRPELEQRLPALPAGLAFALGTALAELDGLGAAAAGGWRPAPASALLLPAGEAMLAALERALEQAGPGPLTLKWKVAALDDGQERRWLEQLLHRLPAGARLRLDANGGWDRATAAAWANRLRGEARLEWLEQPLSPDDQPGLAALAARLPVALDESLRQHPQLLAGGWAGWRVRRPALEGDPRPLLAALQAGVPRLMLSTALETGIGSRLLEHLAALQADGPTPTAPGLAPGWRPPGPLFCRDPEQVWGAAA